VEAMAIYRNDAAVSTRIRELIASRNDSAITAEYMKRFGQR
jgi:hypothetical protein